MIGANYQTAHTPVEWMLARYSLRWTITMHCVICKLEVTQGQDVPIDAWPNVTQTQNGLDGIFVNRHK